jgi:hypothetical protein
MGPTSPHPNAAKRLRPASNYYSVFPHSKSFQINISVLLKWCIYDIYEPRYQRSPTTHHAVTTAPAAPPTPTFPPRSGSCCAICSTYRDYSISVESPGRTGCVEPAFSGSALLRPDFPPRNQPQRGNRPPAARTAVPCIHDTSLLCSAA